MSLQGVKGGDIVMVEGSYALVMDKAPGKVQIRWLARFTAPRWVSARAVEKHWAKRK